MSSLKSIGQSYHAKLTPYTRKINFITKGPVINTSKINFLWINDKKLHETISKLKAGINNPHRKKLIIDGTVEDNLYLRVFSILI